MVNASLVLLLVFAARAPLDGLYLHLWRYRLHARVESRHEHALHTARAVEMLLPGAVLIAGLHLYLWLRPTSLIEEGALP